MVGWRAAVPSPQNLRYKALPAVRQTCPLVVCLPLPDPGHVYRSPSRAAMGFFDNRRVYLLTAVAYMGAMLFG